MENKWKLLYNPFEWIAGWKAFGIGIIIVCATVIIGHFSNTYFIGVQIKHIPNISLPMAFLLQAIGLCATIIIMYLISLISAKNVRFQDILGTVTLSRYPFLLAAFAGFLVRPQIIDSILEGTLTDVFSIIQFSIAGLIMMLILVWGVALLYNAFKVSTNIKGPKSVFLFILIFVLSEAFTMLAVYKLL